MTALRSTLKLIAALFVVVFLGTSCSKEDIAPCQGHDTEVDGSQAKGSQPTISNGQASQDDPTGTVKPDADDDGDISDDGDDLSDSERTRRKTRR